MPFVFKLANVSSPFLDRVVEIWENSTTIRILAIFCILIYFIVNWTIKFWIRAYFLAVFKAQIVDLIDITAFPFQI